MRRTFALSASALVLLALAGCGGNDYHSAVARVLKDLRAMEVVYDNVKFPDQIVENIPKIRKARKQLEVNARAAKAVLPRSGAAADRVHEMYDAIVSDFIRRVKGHETRVAGLENGDSLTNEAQLPAELFELVRSPPEQ
jgi:hypothetical protein